METISGSLYDYPRYYDLVYGSDWRAEFDLLEFCFREHSKLQIQQVFEPACGTGRLLFRLANAGYSVSGLDLNEKSVAFCNKRLHRKDHPESVVVGDMSDFRLPEKVDAAFNTINSFRHLLSEAEAQSHLSCMAEILHVGGLYILGLHLSPTVGEPIEDEAWSAQQGFLCVNTSLQTLSRDLVERRERLSMTTDVYTPTRSFRLSEEMVFRTYTADEFQQLLATVPQFETVALYDFSYRIERTIEISSATEDVVFVLRRVV